MVQRAAQEEGIVFLMPHNVKQEEDGHSLSILEYIVLWYNAAHRWRRGTVFQAYCYCRTGTGTVVRVGRA